MFRSRGFTLVELIIVIVIVGILSIVAVPIYKGYTQKAFMTEAKAVTGSIISSQRIYYSEYNNWYDTLDWVDVSTILDVNTNSSKFFKKFKTSPDGSQYANTIYAAAMADDKDIIVYQYWPENMNEEADFPKWRIADKSGNVYSGRMVTGRNQMKKILIFDTTLRDGSQGAGISFTVEDKIKIAKALDNFGVSYIEGGWPGSNPKDELFFSQAKKIKFKNAKLTAFGSTRRKGIKASEDASLRMIVSSGAKVACIFGKTWDLHVKYALKTTNEENLKMISDSVTFLKSKRLEVIYDAEHFFDGYKSNKEYALETIKTASRAGADIICLCETNGGCLPTDIQKIIREVTEAFPKIKFGIHTHNDSGCAVANSIVAVEEGCVMAQGTINGLGERCGNANLCSIIPGLQIKRNYKCIPDKNLSKLTEISRYVDEIANLIPNDSKPYVGRNAFAHKAGIHVSAIERHSETYEHMNPALVGNERRILVSDLSGKSNVVSKANEMAIGLCDAPDQVKKVIDIVKEKENCGYQYEDADGSFFLLTKKALESFKPFFSLKGYRVAVEKDADGNIVSEATVKLDIRGKEEHTVAEGEGPVNALDNCLRKALVKYYPEIKDIFLTDFKVRVVNSDANTAAKVRVLIESSDSAKSWGTIGVNENIIDASWQALSDSVEYKLIKGSTKK